MFLYKIFFATVLVIYASAESADLLPQSGEDDPVNGLNGLPSDNEEFFGTTAPTPEIQAMDECKLDRHNCDYECVSLPGSYKCICPEGQDLMPSGKKCIDVTRHKKYSSTLPETVQSPNYPNNYSAISIHTWLISSIRDSPIHIKFAEFSVERSKNCSFDHLSIYDGQDDKGRLLGKFCGNELPLVPLSSGKHVYLVFKSDSSVTDRGFRFTFKTEIPRTVLQSSTTPSFIASSDLQSNGRNGFIHSWLLTSNNGFPVHIEFHDFQLLASENCTTEYVEIYDGTNETSPLLSRFCGQEIPPPVWARGQQMFLLFKYQTSSLDKGFNISHSTSCGGKLVADMEERDFYFQLDRGFLSQGELCTWAIDSYQENDSVRIVLKNLSLPCESSYLLVGQKMHCGFQIQEKEYFVPEQVVVLHIEKPNATFTSLSFHLTYQAFSTLKTSHCGGDFTVAKNRQIVLTSPSEYGHNDYPGHHHCVWNVSNGEGRGIIIKIERLRLEASDGCTFDYLAIGARRHCGDQTDQEISIRSDQVYIQFHFHGSNNDHGFKLLIKGN